MIPRVGIVSYKNTAPLMMGLQQMEQNNYIHLRQEYPSQLASLLEKDELDIALVPVAFLKGRPEYKIVSNVCIGSNQKVASVAIFSELPLPEVKEIYLDYQSRTSIQLAKILLSRYWHYDVKFIEAKQGYIDSIKGSTAGVVIGDRAFEMNKPYVYDLVEAWRELTGMPFVFAAWISRKDLDRNFLTQFEEANLVGLNHLKSIAQEQNYKNYDLYKYYTENIDYKLDEDKRKALDFFLSLI
jgi:chorismate dehydratase